MADTLGKAIGAKADEKKEVDCHLGKRGRGY